MRRKARLAAFLLAVGTLAGNPAQAEGPLGIAFVQAPEQGGGICHAQNPDKGFACAKAQCMESGALASDCLRTTWCYPAGWSADIFMQHKEGPHWHQFLCGWNSEADLDAAIEIACKGSSAEYLIECHAVAKWQPDGTKIEY